MLVHCCCDLLFATRIRHAADAAGLACRAAADADALARTLGEVGPDALRLVVVDMAGGDDALSAIATARRDAPAARVVAFGPHVDKALLDAARERGAHDVLPRSAFTARLGEILANAAG